MPSLDDLELGLARLQIQFKTLTIVFEYHPERVGMNLQRAALAAARPPHDIGPMVDELANVLAGWDLSRAGAPIPVTADGIGSLPMGISSEMARAIMEDFNDPKSPIASGGPSGSSTPSPPGSRPDDSATAPTGPTSSSVPNGQGSILPISPGSLTPVGA